MISDKIISPLQSIKPGGAEKVDWDPSAKIAYVITGEYTDEKGGQVVAVDYSKGYDKGKAVAEYFLEGDVSDVRVSSKGLIAASVFDRDTRARARFNSSSTTLKRVLSLRAPLRLATSPIS